MKVEIDTGQISFFSNGENLIDYTIYGAQGGVGERTENIFDYDTITTGYRLQWTTGNLFADSSAIMSDYIEVEPNVTYSIDRVLFVFGYTSDKAYLGTYKNNGFIKDFATPVNTFTVLQNCGYIRLMSYNNSTLTNISITQDTTMVSGNIAPTEYIPYGYKIPVICGRTNNLFYKQIPSANISANGVVVSVTGYNLNIAAVTAGETYSYSNFVGGGVYGFFSDEPAIGSTTYNSSRQLLSVEYGQITIPAGTSYVAFRSPSATENLMLNQGGTVLPYEPYGGETTNIYLDKPLKMVGDETEYVNYATQKQHRVRKNLVQTIATSKTINDITFTVNANGSVTCNGTNHGNNPIIFELNNPDVVFPKGVYITSGCPAGGSITGGYKIQYYDGSGWNYELGSGSTFTLSGNLKYRSRILISKDVTVTNLTFYPMLRLASIEDDTYEPYIEDTELDVTLPALPTLSGTNTLMVDTQVKPSKIMVKTNEGVFQNPPENKSFSYYYYNLKMDTRNEILRAWATKDNGRIVPKSWNHVQFLVKHGLHKDVFHIGDELVCKRGNGDIVWQVIGMDIDEPTDPQYKHSLTLCMRDLLPNDTVAFSARQALFYFPDGLSAGTYYFTITEHTWVASDVNKSFYFTLISDIPKKGQIVLQNAQNVSCENKTLKTYSSSTSTTEIETATMYLWDSSIEATFLGNVNNSLQTNINCLQRAFLGSNNYKESHIRQWINGGEKATLVYQPQTVFDRPPSWNNTNVGLLKGMDNDFLKVVQSTKVKTARNTLTDGGGSDITEDKFFLLSKPQVYGGNTASNIDEGNVYPYFKNYSSLNAASIGADKNRIKTKNGSATWWWLRSTNVSDGSGVWPVGPTGNLGYGYTTSAGGVAAACNIFG